VDVLIADISAEPAASVALQLAASGHRVHTCRDPADAGAAPCAALRGVACPLDAEPIDVAVRVGAEEHLGGGSLCAVRRRIPVVLVDLPDDALAPWASASVPASDVAEAVSAAAAAPLPGHTDEARRVAQEQLRQLGLDETVAEVQVMRQRGGLQIEISVDDSLTRQRTEALAVHVAQRVRGFDPWAKHLDVRVVGR